MKFSAILGDSEAWKHYILVYITDYPKLMVKICDNELSKNPRTEPECESITTHHYRHKTKASNLPLTLLAKSAISLL